MACACRSSSLESCGGRAEGLALALGEGGRGMAVAEVWQRQRERAGGRPAPRELVSIWRAPPRTPFGEGRSESGGPSKPHWKRARTDDRTTSSSAQELLWSTCARPDWRRRSYTPRGDVDVMCTKRPVTAQSRLAEPEDGRSKQRQRYLAPSGVDFFHQHSIIRQPQHDQAQPPHQSQSVSGIDRRYKRGEGLSRRRFTTGWDVNDSMPQRQASGADAHANTRREVQSRGATASTDTLDLRWKLNANKRPHWHSRNRP